MRTGVGDVVDVGARVQPQRGRTEGARGRADDPSRDRAADSTGRGGPPAEPALRRLLTGLTAVRDGDFGTRLPGDTELLGELAAAFNGMVDQVAVCTAEVTRVAREVGGDGRLGGRAVVPGACGTWKVLTDSVNAMAGNLTTQVRSIAQVSTAVAEGDLSQRIGVEARGEVADLKDNINAMVESLRATARAGQEQDWLTSNLARLSGLMQGRRDLDAVAELIMDELTPLVAAQYGAFYLAHDTPDGVELRLIGSYGRPTGTGTGGSDGPVRFRLGESLVGQAARSRRTIALDDIPAGYVISSGLGHTPPANLIVLPILAEDRVLGVIELASVYRFTPIQRALLDRLMETVGANVHAIAANARTDALLGESQRLAAELQARSGELQVRQEELQRSNAELEEKAALLAVQNRDIETKNREIGQARRELEERAQQLALASRYKSEFLANMSHELRTPLNSLLVLAQLLAQNPHQNLTPKQVEYAGVIHSAGSDLLQLINDILDLSRVEAGQLDIAPEWVPLRGLVEWAESTFRPQATQKGLEFRVEVAPGTPTEVLTDDARLRQVLGNLLSNAVKFTEAGEVALRVHPAPPEEASAGAASQGPVLALEVRDTGIGIAEQQLEAVFGAFQQADGTTSRRYGGTGLGLSISREIAQLLGGSIQASSVRGEGSVFTFRLPVAHPGAPGQRPAAAGDAAADPLVLSSPAPDRNGHPGRRHPEPGPDPVERASEPRRLLIIEDRPRGLLSLVAESVVAELDHGRGPADPRGRVRVRSAAGTAEVAEALTAEPYDCVVLGLDANGESGLRSLDALLDDPALRGVPVLVHPTRRLDPARQRDIAERARHRPLQVLSGLDELRERIARHLLSHRPRGSAGGAAEGLDGRTILVIDDDIRNVFALTAMLEQHGVRVLHAENGREGINALDLNPDVDLILMDVMMPEMDGYAATAAIRAMPRHAELPIIAVTAKAMDGDREKSLACGADDHVTKPVDSAQLISCIRRRLR